MKRAPRKTQNKLLQLALVLLCSQLLLAAGQSTASTATPTPTPAATTKATPTATPAATAASTATPTPTPAATTKSTPTATPAATTASTATPTPTPAATTKSTPTATPAATTKPTPTATPAATTASTATPTATSKATPASTAKATASSTPAATPKATPAATPAPTTVASAAAALLNALTGSTVPVTTVAPTPTPIATPAQQATPLAASPPPRSPSPPPPAPTPAPAPPPPPPTDPNATALLAKLQLQGANLWPFTDAEASALVTSLSQSLTTVTISDINIVNATQASRRRRALLARSLLGSNDTVDAVLELEGTTSAAALSINSNLATNVVNGALQKTLARNGLITQSLALVYSQAAVPEVQVACSSGSFNNVCISKLTGGGLSTGVIVAIAVGVGGGALVLIAVMVTCVLRRSRRKAALRVRQETAPKKVMTPQHAQPYWEQNQKEHQRDVASLVATPGSSVDEHGNPVGVISMPGTAMSGDEYTEMREMGGRMARDQLKMKLPAFAGRTRTSSNLGGISRTTSAISRSSSMAGGISRTVSHMQSNIAMVHRETAEEGGTP